LKRLKLFKKLNKLTSVKVAIIAAIMIAVEVLCGILIYGNFSDNTYGITYADYKTAITTIAEGVQTEMGDSVNSLRDDASSREQFFEIVSKNTAFSDYVLFTEAGDAAILGGSDLLEGTLSSYGIDYGNVGTLSLSGNTYLFAAEKIGASAFYVGGLIDFSEQQNSIDAMLHNLVAVLIICGILILAAFVIYAFWAGEKQRKGKFDYKITVDGTGKVLHTNGKFKQEFYDIKEIKLDLKDFNKKAYNIIRLKGLNGEKLLVTKLYVKSSGKIKIYASEIDNASSLIDLGDDANELTANGKARASLSKAYDDFVKRGKRTLIGVMFISNLNSIAALFGKETALDIQKIVIKKAKEKFGYVYELDLGKIGMVYPDGKKLDILLADMGDNLTYIGQPIHMEDNLFTVELKSGFAICDATMTDLSFDYAIKAAEAARQRAIDTKIADYIIYHESQKKLYTKYFITYNIKDMLAEGAFEMEYQPQYNIKEARIEGFEALFRVKKSWNVNVDTFSFITYAERTGAMVQLGDFIFDTGMRFAKKLEGKNVSVSLNVSPVQLMQAGFAENFLKLYRKYDLKPGSICVEITESFLMTNFQETLKKLEILKNNGIQVHLDDFGTEYSSLLYIKTLPISTIKIDKEFIRDVTKNKESQAVIRFITNIAKLLDHTTICEGVETVEEFDMLNALGCDTIQGWLIGKSMKPDDALKIVDTFDYNAVVAAKKAAAN
jgi:EAL domain-containing protein (putative c-di-GMP-specific phosphodiesterase class I)